MAERFELYEDEANPGKWRWSLKDGNNKRIAASGESFDSHSNARRAAQNVKDTAPTAPIVDR